MSAVYAIGDVHGRLDLLQKIIAFIDDRSKLAEQQPRVFFLGDIVDRGYDSRGAMEIVRKTIERWPDSRLILGNHEEMFRDVLQDPNNKELSRKWLANGGYNTLFSYMGFDIEYSPDVIADILNRFSDHLELMASASDIEVVGRYAFVHAGIDPHLPLQEQDPHRTRRIQIGRAHV